MDERWRTLGLLLSIPVILMAAGSQPHPTPEAGRIIIATNPEDQNDLQNVLILVESLRTFGGRYRACPVWVFSTDELLQSEKDLVARLKGFHADFKSSQTPAEALRFFLGRKVFAAAQAEQEATGKTEFLIWMDPDTVILQEPDELLLEDRFSFGYRPVMHQRIGSLYAEPPDEFWTRVYARLSVPPDSVFPVTAPADNAILRAYFNAGLPVVRPERGVFRRWARDFATLYEDPYFQEACRQDRFKWIFLHQVALVGAAFHQVTPREMVLLSDRVNFPLFFKEQFGAEREFDSVDGVITLRHESFLKNPDPGWREKLKGPADRVAWIKEHFPAGERGTD